MSRPDRRALLHRLVEVLEDPAPINAAHARHVSGLISRVLGAEADRPERSVPPARASRTKVSPPRGRGSGGVGSGASSWAGSRVGDQLAALAPEDPAEENPAL